MAVDGHLTKTPPDGDRRTGSGVGNRRTIRPILFALFSPTLRMERMAKIRISSTDLVWAFTEKLKSFENCGRVAIAIIPAGRGWMAIASQKRIWPLIPVAPNTSNRFKNSFARFTF
jgi:hypothetical protein